MKNYPTGKRAADAWFRLGECYLKTNQMTEAASAYNQVMARFPKSESAWAQPPIAWGPWLTNNRDFATAARLFDTSEYLTTVPEIKLVAMHNKALAYKVAGQKSNALAAYKAFFSPCLRRTSTTTPTCRKWQIWHWNWARPRMHWKLTMKSSPPPRTSPR